MQHDDVSLDPLCTLKYDGITKQEVVGLLRWLVALTSGKTRILRIFPFDSISFDIANNKASLP